MYTSEYELSFKELFQSIGYDIHDMIIGLEYDVMEHKFQILSKSGWNNILSIIRKPDTLEYIIESDNEALSCSAEHKVLVKDKTGKETFIEAQNLTGIDQFIYVNGHWSSFNVVKTNNIINIVDLSVDNDHTYLSNNMLSHNTSFGDPYSTSGGKAVAFHSSVRFRLKSKGQIKVKKTSPDPISGIVTECKVIKNRVGPPGRKIDFDIYFDSGIDNYGSWLNTMKDYGIVKQSGAYYTYESVDTETGVVEEIKFLSRDVKTMLTSRDDLKEQMYNDICDKYIMKYQSTDEFGIDDIEVSEVDAELDL